MKILHISVAGICDRFYFPFLCRIKAKLKIDQDIYIPFKRDEYSKSELGILDRYNEQGIRVMALPIKKMSDRILYFKKINKYYRKLEHSADLKTYNIIHAHSLFSDGGVAYIAKKKKSIPYVVAVRTTDILFMKLFPYLRFFAKKIIENANTIVFITPSLMDSTIQILYKNILSDDIGKRIKIIPNGIDDFWQKQVADKSKTLYGNEICFIQVSRLNKQKQVDKTIKAIKILRDKGYEVCLKILGDGEELRRFQKITMSLGLSDCVKFIGFVSEKEEIKKHYSSSDIFVMPSLNETFGLTYIEAMSQGLPIIGIKGTGVSGFFDNESVGCFIDRPDGETIAEAAIKIMSDYDKMSRKCIDSIKVFNWETVIEKYAEIYFVK